jgi:hypothetical protein
MNYFSIQVVHYHQRVGIVWDFGKEGSPQHLTERALVQVLHGYFHVSLSQIEKHTFIGKVTVRGWKPFAKRARNERCAAFLAAYWWLLANGENADGKGTDNQSKDFWSKAAPYTRLVHELMGNDGWNGVADLLGLSHTQRSVLLTCEPPAPLISPNSARQAMLPTNQAKAKTPRKGGASKGTTKKSNARSSKARP